MNELFRHGITYTRQQIEDAVQSHRDGLDGWLVARGPEREYWFEPVGDGYVLNHSWRHNDELADPAADQRTAAEEIK